MAALKEETAAELLTPAGFDFLWDDLSEVLKPWGSPFLKHLFSRTESALFLEQICKRSLSLSWLLQIYLIINTEASFLSSGAPRNLFLMLKIEKQWRRLQSHSLSLSVTLSAIFYTCYFFGLKSAFMCTLCVWCPSKLVLWSHRSVSNFFIWKLELYGCLLALFLCCTGMMCLFFTITKSQQH